MLTHGVFLGFEVSEADNSMDATNSLQSGSNPPMGNNVESVGSTFNCRNDSAFLPQPRYTQTMYGINDSRGAQLLLGTNTPSSGSMLIARSGPAIGLSSNGLPSSHFASPHHLMRPQSSVGAISDYRM